MKIVAGLGNPGPKYETTRHNAGFLALDRLVDSWRAAGPAAVQDGEAYQASRSGEKVILARPRTYMNLSGKCVAPLMRFYKCSPEDLIVIHDDLDLPFGTLRIKTGGGAGGHNGLKSIDAHLGREATGYHRIRIGIGRPGPESPISTVDWVLQPFSDDELFRLDSILDNAVTAIDRIISGDIASAMNEFNKRG
ncbi:MAG: aminoacyl-tRNA hydrolase [Bdellovibrionales bacterium GWB1_55_8]|nr:MAG: aminoacyl-tRNA hydrolase [Bdellovibrionales bacterium GWB1_55_8]